jgi:hypothetical protein
VQQHEFLWNSHRAIFGYRPDMICPSHDGPVSIIT